MSYLQRLYRQKLKRKLSIVIFGKILHTVPPFQLFPQTPIALRCDLFSSTAYKAASVYTLTPDNTTIDATRDKNSVTLDEVTVDGKTFYLVQSTFKNTQSNTAVIQTQGSLQKNKNHIRFEIPAKTTATVEVKFFNHGSSAGGRTAQIAPITVNSSDESKNTLGSVTSGKEKTVNSSSEIVTTSFEVTNSADSSAWYAVGASNGVYFTQIKVSY